MGSVLQRLAALVSAANCGKVRQLAGARRLRAWKCAVGAALLCALFAGQQPGTAEAVASQQGGLPALEKRVAALEQKVADQAASIAALHAGLAGEKAAREAADADLQNALNSEAAARQAADTALQNAVDGEAAARQSGDTALQNALGAETTARQNADTALQNGLNAEAGIRQAVDTALQNQINPLQNQINSLAFILGPFSRSGSDIFLTGANLHIRNGQHSTDTANGTGNLVVGYNETGNAGGDFRGGSHNVIIGRGNSYTGFGGLVVGEYNRVSSWSICAGNSNRATGDYSAAIGGSFNIASARLSSVLGGSVNRAEGDESTITGGHWILVGTNRSWAAGGDFQNVAGGPGAYHSP